MQYLLNCYILALNKEWDILPIGNYIEALCPPRPGPAINLSLLISSIIIYWEDRQCFNFFQCQGTKRKPLWFWKIIRRSNKQCFIADVYEQYTTMVYQNPKLAAAAEKYGHSGIPINCKKQLQINKGGRQGKVTKNWPLKINFIC